jgi:hypothetical protein
MNWDGPEVALHQIYPYDKENFTCLPRSFISCFMQKRFNGARCARRFQEEPLDQVVNFSIAFPTAHFKQCL